MTTVAACLLLSACSSHIPAPVTTIGKDYESIKRGSYRGSYYEVQKGDTLYFISYITGREVKDIVAANKLSHPYTIFPGQKLQLWKPKYVAPAYGKAGTVAVVKPSVKTAAKVVQSKPEPKPVPKPAIKPSVKTAAKVVQPKPEPKPVPKPAIKPSVKTAAKVAQPKPEPKPVPKPAIKPLVKTAAKVVQPKQGPKSVPKPAIKPSVKTAAKVVQPKQEPKPVPKPAIKPQPKPKTSVQKTANKNVDRKRTKEYAQNSKSNKVVTKSAGNTNKVASWSWPTKGRIIAKFSSAENGNKGIDIAGQRGQAVKASAGGVVVYAGNALRGYGNLVIIKHSEDYLSAYAHNDKVLVREKQTVEAGQKIASMGSSGTKNVRLHFEIRYKGKSVNPLRYLPK